MMTTVANGRDQARKPRLAQATRAMKLLAPEAVSCARAFLAARAAIVLFIEAEPIVHDGRSMSRTEHAIASTREYFFTSEERHYYGSELEKGFEAAREALRQAYAA